MAKAITVKVTDKTDFEKYSALNLGDIMTFDGLGVYTYPDGDKGQYDQWWLEQMLDSGAFAEVLSERSFRGQDAPEWATAVNLFKDVWYWEEDINQPDGARFQNTMGKLPVTYDKDTVKGWDQCKILPTFVEEQLPPAPESVLYVNSFNWGIKVTPNCGGDLLIATGDPNRWHSGWTGATISADDALQLAGDLRRMAMACKRKLKQSEDI